MTNYIYRPMKSSVVQIIVVTASVVLGMFLYPKLKGVYTNFVLRLYRNLEIDKLPEEKKPEPKTERTVSVVGESRTISGHSRTKTATSPENEKVIEKEHTFAPETDDDPAPMDDINIPLDKIESLTEGEFDPDEEALELESEDNAVLASRASYDELMSAGKVITKDKPSNEEKDKAGKVLYENKNTKIVEQVVSKDEITLTKVNALIHFHMKKHHLNAENSDSDDLENFDIDSIF